MNVRSVLSRLAALAVLGLAAPALAAPNAYIPNNGSGTVSVIDTASNTVVATIPGVSCGYGVVVNPAGTRAYVTDTCSSRVFVIDTASNTVVTTVPTGGGPERIAVHPSGSHVYTSNHWSDSVTVIATASNTVVATVPVPATPHPIHLAVNPAGTEVWVAGHASTSLSIISTASNAVVATLNYGTSTNHEMVFNADGSRAWLGTDSNTILVLNPPARNVLGSFASNCPYSLALLPSGSRLYVADPCNNQVRAYDASSNALVATVGGFNGPYGITAKPDGTAVYVPNVNVNSVSAISTASNSVTAAIGVGSIPYARGKFIAQPTTADISGTITNSLGGGGMSGISVALGGAASSSTSTNGSGGYTFADLSAGSYTITPSVYNYIFSPLSRTVNLAGSDATGQNFVGTYNAIPDITILRGLVAAANLSDTRLRNNLLAPLDAALMWLNGNDPNRIVNACSNLAKFISVVRQNYSAGKLTLATRDAWVQAANDILALSGCPTR